MISRWTKPGTKVAAVDDGGELEHLPRLEVGKIYTVVLIEPDCEDSNGRDVLGVALAETAPFHAKDARGEEWFYERSSFAPLELPDFIKELLTVEPQTRIQLLHENLRADLECLTRRVCVEGFRRQWNESQATTCWIEGLRRVRKS